MRKALLPLIALVLVAAVGCGDGVSGGKIEPESKGGSPITNPKGGPQTPTNP